MAKAKKTMSDDCRAWLESQENEFMQPVAEPLTRSEAIEYTGDSEARAGWYARLSASGYLDCTDWQGPYSSEDSALESLYDSYGN